MIKREISIPADSLMSRQRAAGIVQAAVGFEAGIMLQQGERIINAKSTLGVLTIPSGVSLTLIAEGADEAEAVETIAALVTAG